jgi:hypothetical protein
MAHIMPKNMGVFRPERVLVVGTVEYYMTVEHKVWEKQLAARETNLSKVYICFEKDIVFNGARGPYLSPG